jgi:hypothetical protein
MPQSITIKIKTKAKSFERETRGAIDASGGSLKQFKSAIDSMNAGFKALRRAVGELRSSLSATHYRSSAGS